MTLIELLITVAVIALMIAFALPVAGKMRESAQEVGCLSNIRKLGGAALAYAVDHQGLLPRGDTPRMDLPGEFAQWPYVLERYLGVDYLKVASNRELFRASAFSCPAEKAAPTYNYAMNRQFNERLSGAAAYIRIGQVKNPSRYVLFSDGYYDRTIFTDLRSKMIDMTRITRRHGGYPNFVYADGHAASYRGPIYGISDAEGRNNPEIRAMWEYNYPLP